MKILFILENFDPYVGGAETLFKSLADELAKKGHQVSVITSHPGKGVLSTEYSDGDLTVHRYRFVNRYLFTILAFFPAWYYAFRHDVIHTTSYNAALPAYFAGLFSGRKVFITFHEYWGALWFTLPFFGRISRWLHYFFEGFLIRLPFHRFVAVSENTKLRLISAGIPSNRVERIYNGIKYEEWKRPELPTQLKSEAFQFLFFGRLGVSKGIDLLVGAAGILILQDVSFTITIVIGKEPIQLLKKIQDQIKTNGLSTYVKILHHLPRKNLMQMIVCSDAVVIPSYSEGFGYTAVESAALKVPIVSSQQGSLPEVVSGLYIGCEDFSEKGLAKAMMKATRGEWTVSAVREFHLEQTIKEYISLYNKIV